MSLLRSAPLLLVLPVALLPAEARAGTCGPADSFGYLCFDEIDSSGPSFTWESPSLSASVADGGLATIPIGFSFGFYGEAHTDVAVSDDGALVFGAGASAPGASNVCLSGTVNDPLIAVWWDSFDPAGASIQYETFGSAPNRRLVVAWSGIAPPLAPPNSDVSFQVKLFEGSDAIELHYLDATIGMLHPADEGAGATVGIAHPTAGAQEYSCDTASLVDQRAILFALEDTGDDDDATGDDDDATGDDDDATGDDDDATGDDDDATGDDDDATGDDDDSAGAPAGVFIACDAAGPGGGSALALLAVFAVLAVRRARPLLLLLPLLLLPGLAVAETLLIGAGPVPADVEDGRPVEPPKLAELGGIYLLGAASDAICSSAFLAPEAVTREIEAARRLIGELEMDEAKARLLGIRQTLTCLAEPVAPEVIWDALFLSAVAATYADGYGPEARMFLARAHSVLPGRPFDQSYPPTLRDGFLRTQKEVLDDDSAQIVGSGVAEGPGAAWLDGRPLGSVPLEVRPGTHLLLVTDLDGNTRGAEIALRAGDVVAVATAETVGGVVLGMADGDRANLEYAVVGALRAPDATVRWLQPGRAAGGHTAGADPPPTDPRLLVLAGAGYALTWPDHYIGIALDVSVRLVGPLRLDLLVRPAVSRKYMRGGLEGVSLLPAFGLGLSVRIPTGAPVAPVFGVAGQLAPNTARADVTGVLGGVLGRVGLDVSVGPVFVLRPVFEAGTLGRLVTARGLLTVGVGVGR